MIIGTVKWFDDAKGFGLVTPDDGSGDLFALFYAANKSSGGLETIKAGQKLSFVVMQDAKGKQASNIRLI